MACCGRVLGAPSHACLPCLGLPTTPAAPSLPPTEMSPALSPPRGLVAVRTPRGVLLHWDPPELVPKTLDGYVLEGRQGSQGWEVLDRAVAGTEMQLLVPGLIKVCVRGRHREVPPRGAPGPGSVPQTWASHPPFPTARSFWTELGWAVLGPDPLPGPPPPGRSVRVPPRGPRRQLCQRSEQHGQRVHFR